MSAAPAFEIRCDCTGCPGCTAHDNTGACGVSGGDRCGLAYGDYGTATQVRARARHAGWRVNLPGGQDRCDECR